MLRRYLALQGTWSGALGVVVGVATGLAIVPLLDGVIANDGRIAIGSIDVVIIALTALVTATAAAIVPTRDLARTSVLAALGGRRPVAKVRPRQVRIGAVLVAGGLTALWLAVTSARNANDTGDGLGAAVVLAGFGGLAVLAGMCCVCPVVVDLVARVGSRRRGATRLATRGLGRHRARSAALVAAIAAIGAAAMAAGATAEEEFATQTRSGRQTADLDLVSISTAQVGPDGEVRLADPTTRCLSRPWIRSRRWSASRRGTSRIRSWCPSTTARSMTMMVADVGLLDLIGLTGQQRAALADVDAAEVAPVGMPMADRRPDANLGSLETISICSPRTTSARGASSRRQAVERLGLDPVPGEVFGQLQHDIDRDQYDRLTSLNVFTNESAYFVDVSQGEVMTNVSVGYPERDDSTLARAIILLGMLLLTTVVVGVGMALWAAEGKDERDALVSIGAAPSVLARVVGIKAWLLAFVGGLIAVPLGYGTLRLAIAAAGNETTFPWFVAVGVVVVVPLVIGVIATLGSAVAQRVRPVRMSTLTTD